MSKIMRIVADTQLAINVPIRILGARLVHTGATTADIYDEVFSSAVTAAKKKIALATTTTILSDNAILPPGGILFGTGCYIDWAAGELFLTVPDEYTV